MTLESCRASGHSARFSIVGEDPILRELLARAARVAPTRLPVLITGESGTGKELVAHLIHQRSRAPAAPFVAVNCGTLPRELADSELFGHERGAFTGAGGRKIGWFEEADGGTLVLDEVGELPLDLQPKLLRVLDSGRLRRVGGSGEIAVNVRIVAMTLRDLRREVERGAFRIDLYHRLAGFELALPPLRHRRGDIPLLVEHFLTELSEEMGPRTISPEAVERLSRSDWPGNVRELRHVLQRAAVLCPAQIGLGGLDLTCSLPAPEAPAHPVEEVSPRLADGEGSTPSWPVTSSRSTGLPPGAQFQADTLPGDLLCLTGQTFDQIERTVLGWALRNSGGSRRRAALSLDLPRSTFCDKVRRYGLGQAPTHSPANSLAASSRGKCGA